MTCTRHTKAAHQIEDDRFEPAKPCTPAPCRTSGCPHCLQAEVDIFCRAVLLSKASPIYKHSNNSAGGEGMAYVSMVGGFVAAAGGVLETMRILKK
jgi:hypothetical protein